MKMTRLVLLDDEAMHALAVLAFGDGVRRGLRRLGMIPLRSVFAQTLVVILAGLILYAFLNARRQRLGESPEPVDLPDDLGTTAAAINVSTNGHTNGATPVHSQTTRSEVKL